MTNDALMRRNYLCINPYHYGYEQNSSTLEPKQTHLCRKHLRLQSSGLLSSRIVIFFCEILKNLAFLTNVLTG